MSIDGDMAKIEYVDIGFSKFLRLILVGWSKVKPDLPGSVDLVRTYRLIEKPELNLWKGGVPTIMDEGLKVIGYTLPLDYMPNSPDQPIDESTPDKSAAERKMKKDEVTKKEKKKKQKNEDIEVIELTNGSQDLVTPAYPIDGSRTGILSGPQSWLISDV